MMVVFGHPLPCNVYWDAKLPCLILFVLIASFDLMLTYGTGYCVPSKDIVVYMFLKSDIKCKENMMHMVQLLPLQTLRFMFDML